MKDKRYSINLEFCGRTHKKLPKHLKQGQMYVARFCGEWIGSAITENRAKSICIFHEDNRTEKMI